MSKRTVTIVRVNPGLNIIGKPGTIHEGVAYSFTFRGEGGQPGKYVFSTISALTSLPTGITFTDNGDGTATLSGTATATGDAFPLRVRLENNGRAIEKSFTLRVPGLTLQLVQTAPVYSGVAITAGQVRLVATGGSGTGYTYSLTTNPTFVDSVTGYINSSLSALSPGTYTDTATVIDSASNTISIPIGFIVLPPLFLDCILPTESEKGIGPDPKGPSYDFTFKVSGATGTVTWASLSGAFPLDWSLDSATGTLSGATSYTGQQSITVSATDSGTGFTLDITMPIFLYGEFKSANSPSRITVPVGARSLVFAGFSGGKAPYRIVSFLTALPSGLTVQMAPDGSHYFSVLATEAFAETLIEANISDSLGVPINGAAYVLLTAVDSINEKIQVRDAASDIGDPGPSALKFTGSGGTTVTVTDTSDSSGNNERTVDIDVPISGTSAALDADTDGTLAANSDLRVATQKATRTFVENAVTGLLDFKGATDCSGNPNYPAASKGDAYVVSIVGKIGGASGTAVDVGDVYVASADNAGGTQAAVGASWFVLEHNLAGALLSANNLSDLASAATARANLGLGDSATKNVGTTAGTVAAGDDSRFGSGSWLSASDVMRLQGGEDCGRSEPLASEASFPTLQALGFIPPKGADGKILTADSKQSPGLIWGYGDTSYRYGYRDHDHFLQGINNTGNKTQSGHAGGAGASVTQVTGLGKRHPGVFALATRATNDRSWVWGVPPGISSPMFVSGDGIFEVTWWFNQKFLSSGTETYRADYGVNSASTLAAALSNSFTAGYNLTNLASGAMFLRVYSNGAAGGLVNGTTVLVADTWYRVRLVLDKVNANITMWLCPLDGVETLEATYTGTLPTDGAPYAPFVEVFRSLGTTGATDMQTYVDAWEVNASYANQV